MFIQIEYTGYYINRGMKGLKGIHIISGGKEDLISVLISETGLLKK